jgi:hypothetical protein
MRILGCVGHSKNGELLGKRRIFIPSLGLADVKVG